MGLLARLFNDVSNTELKQAQDLVVCLTKLIRVMGIDGYCSHKLIKKAS